MLVIFTHNVTSHISLNVISTSNSSMMWLLIINETSSHFPIRLQKKSRLKTIPPEQIPYVMQPWKERFSCCLHRILVIQGFSCERPLYDVRWIWDVWINRFHQSRQCLLCTYLEFFYFTRYGYFSEKRREEWGARYVIFFAKQF